MSEWYTIVPIDPTYNSKGERFIKSLDLGRDVSFTIVPSWFDKIVGREHLSFSQRQKMDNTMYVLMSKYDASSLGDPDSNWKGDNVRSKQDIALENISIANLALWLIKPSVIGFALVLHIEENDDERILRRSFTTQQLIPHQKDEDNYLEMIDFEHAQKFNLVVHELDRTSSIWVAYRTLWTALIIDSWEVRFLLLWIALEALFGTDIEIMYRISQRISFFVSTSRKEASELVKNVKNSYKWRSQIVHGMKLNRCKKEESALNLYDTESFVRKALVKILNDSKLIDIFCENEEREKYLDSLPFYNNH